MLGCTVFESFFLQQAADRKDSKLVHPNKHLALLFCQSLNRNFSWILTIERCRCYILHHKFLKKLCWTTTSQTPCWSVLEFWHFWFEESSSSNLIFCLFGTILKAKQAVEIKFWTKQKIKFIKLDFSNKKFQNSSTDQQGESL